MRVSRTCTGIREMRGERREEAVSRPLEAFRSAPAYVLLGDPGAGKTTAFEMECEALGEEAYHLPVSADEFLSYDANDLPDEWRGKTMFIDGLDEVRAGSQDVAAQFREIRKILRALDAPRFRLSCRHADWRGRLDENKLKTITGDSDLIILQLDPLTLGDVEKILQARSDIPNASKFIALAQEKRMGVFLENPQALRFLAEVVGAGGKWPESRKELFEKACEKMVREHNEEHRAARDCQNALDAEQLLDAAGRLCAVQLISGAYGYTRRGEADAKYPALEQCGYDLAALRLALATKLFKGVGDNRFAPLHRHIAEFLAARYLAGVIKECLPVRRIIALITGSDGIVVTEMRGLSAWLAAHSKDARSYLIEQDPVGVGLYGDISTFLRDEKCALLHALKGETSRLDFPEWQQAVAFRTLATQGMESEFRKILTDSERGEAHQLVVDLVLRVLHGGKSLAGLSEILLKIVRDARNPWWPVIRKLALEAFIQNCPANEDKTNKLNALLKDIQSGSVSDPDNELLGTLLTHLYPRHLSPSEVWDYFLEVGSPPINGRYYRFWQNHLIDKNISSDDQVAELLDGLSRRLPEWDFSLKLGNRKLYNLPINLLFRGLKTLGDDLDIQRLYDWLSVGIARNYRLGHSSQKVLFGIRGWLEQRHDMQKAITMEGLTRCSVSDNHCDFDICASGIEKYLYDARRPPDYGLWCLEKAIDLANTQPEIAQYLLKIAARTIESQNGNEGFSLDLLIERAGSVKVLEERLNQILSPQSIPSVFFEYQEESKKYIEKQRREKIKLLDHIRSNEVALRENGAAPALLDYIAQKYFSNNGILFFDFDSKKAYKAVKQWLQGDERLTEAALQGLRGVIDREDVPNVEEIFDLHGKGRRHYLALPFLAGLAELERIAPETDASQWAEDRICKSVAFYYCTHHADYRPRWYERLLLTHTRIIAEMQVHVTILKLRSGGEVIYKLNELARDPDHKEIAKHASILILRDFPVRCTLSQIESLNHLLWGAILCADRAELQELIARKMTLKSMNVAQRVCWLAAGLMVSPAMFGGTLDDFVQGQERRIRSLWQFIYSSYGTQFRFRNLDISVLELLIRLLGSCFAGGRDFTQWRDAPKGSRIITTEEEASDFVGDRIRHLADSPEEEASNALINLADDPALERWRDVLKQAQDNQRAIRRDADYSHPGVKQICKTLDGGPPANPADLAALVMDRLCEIARQIRTDNADAWLQYWNVDSYGKADKPRHEDSCRKTLLLHLRQRLTQGIDAQPEGQYANDKRADIRVSYAGFNVPVEIKKNAHPKLWSAMHDQLIAKYAVDPGADGYGIYLVFWFGSEYTRTPHENGSPDSAKEMERWLQDSLSPEQARKISVCVIDVSIPEGKSAGK